MRIAILDYCNGAVDIIDNVPQLTDNEQIEDYLTDTLGYSLDQISWMHADKISINFLTPDDYD